jgi:hypothetical protein
MTLYQASGKRAAVVLRDGVPATQERRRRE